MEAYRELAEAVLAASAVCTLWHCPADGQDYSLQDLSFVSQLVDIEEELPGESCYIVFPDGEIGLLDIPDREILRLYLPVEDPEKIQAALAYDIGQLQSMAREMEEALQIVSSSGPGTSAPLRSSVLPTGKKAARRKAARRKAVRLSARLPQAKAAKSAVWSGRQKAPGGLWPSFSAACGRF